MAQQTFEEIVAAVKQAESRGKRYAADGKTLTTSPKGALGEMQVMPKTILDPGFGVAPAKDKSPDEIARVGVDYLQAMKQKYGDTEKALIAYNWGPGSTDKWIAAGADPKKLPAETRTYVERVKGFLGKDVPRETMAKKEREPLPPSLPPMAEATPAKATVAMASGKNLPDIKAMPASYQAAFALAALADAQDEEDDRVYNENKQTETEEFFANYKPVNKLASLDLSVTPVMMKDGGEVDAEDLTKPSFGNPNIRKQGEAARRLAAMRDVNTLPDPKTYAAVAGALGTRPDQMGFSVLHPKYQEIRDVANPAFAASIAAQISPLAVGPGTGRLVGAAERALEPAVRRTLEGGGKASQMLQDLAAPPSQMFVRARPEAAARHADLQAKGLSPEEIRAQNLTLVDNRGNLIEEISDAPAVLQQKTASVPRNFYEMLKHPELESIYPTYDMPQVMMETTKRKGAPLAMGNFDVQNNMISGRIRDLPEDDARSMVRGTVLHEGQHAIQSAEGFTEGANPGAFIAYVQARQGKYNPDATVNENVIREMERAYPNIGSVADNLSMRLQADKYMRYAVGDPDRYVGETLYRHMPGEVQAELARVRSNLTPEQLKATPLEVSMQQLGVDPKNILEMNKMGSRPDRYIGDVEYDPTGYADGGPVYRAEGSPMTGERKLDRETMDMLRRQGTSPASLTRVAPPADIGSSAAGLPGLMLLADPRIDNTNAYGYVLDSSDDKKNFGMAQAMFLNKSRSEDYPDTIAHETEHLLARQNLGSAANINSKFDELIGNKGISRLNFVRDAVKAAPYLKEKYDLQSSYLDPKMLEYQSKFGLGKNLLYEQLASLAALEQRHKIDLTKDPELRKTLFSRPDVRETYNALTGLRQTRLDPRDLPPHTRVPEPGMLDAVKKVFKRADGGMVYRADGSPETGEQLTPQQIERIAAQESAEREAASNAAFIAQKSGIGRKAGPVSQALQSGQGQIEFLKGMTNVPQNILGAPMDISNMIANVYGGGVEKPFMGSEYLKEKSRAAGLGFKPSTDPTLAGFYGAGDLGSNLVNPAGVTRTGVKAAEKTGAAAKMLARDFQGYNQQLAVPGASYAVRNKGTPVAMSGRFNAMSTSDEAEQVVRALDEGEDMRLGSKDKPLGDWFSKTVTRYLRSDFATPQDQLVRAAEEGKVLHLAPKEFSDSSEDQILKEFLRRRQNTIKYMREAEGFGKSNMATQPYGQRIEDLTDISASPERLEDLTPNRVPPSMRNLVDTRPETRVMDFAPGIIQNLKLNELRDKMLDVRQSDGKYGAYGQPAAKIPSEFLLPDDTLAKLNVAAASNRMARYTNWQNETRQKMATTALRADPAFPRAELQEGKFLGVALPDIKKNPEAKQLVIDVGCDGGWCTRYTPNAEAYASGFSRLHVIVTGEGKQARPVAQFAIADSGPSYDTKRFSITEVKEKGNTVDFENNPALPAIQEYIQYLDKTYNGLEYVDGLKKLRMTALPEYPMQLLDLFNPTVQQRRMLENKYGSEENGFRAVRDKAVDLNNGSRFMTGNEDAVANSLEQAMQLLVGPKETLARRIQMNLFGLPKEKAHGGMIERQPNDNRRYL